MVNRCKVSRESSGQGGGSRGNVLSALFGVVAPSGAPPSVFMAASCSCLWWTPQQPILSTFYVVAIVSGTGDTQVNAIQGSTLGSAECTTTALVLRLSLNKHTFMYSELCLLLDVLCASQSIPHLQFRPLPPPESFPKPFK